jgi:hypothetical protein
VRLRRPEWCRRRYLPMSSDSIGPALSRVQEQREGEALAPPLGPALLERRYLALRPGIPYSAAPILCESVHIQHVIVCDK